MHGNWDNNDTIYLRPKVRTSGSHNQTRGLWPNTCNTQSLSKFNTNSAEFGTEYAIDYAKQSWRAKGCGWYKPPHRCFVLLVGLRLKTTQRKDSKWCHQKDELDFPCRHPIHVCNIEFNSLDLQISELLRVKRKTIVSRHRQTRICSCPVCEPRHEILCLLEGNWHSFLWKMFLRFQHKLYERLLHDWHCIILFNAHTN